MNKSAKFSLAILLALVLGIVATGGCRQQGEQAVPTLSTEDQVALKRNYHELQRQLEVTGDQLERAEQEMEALARSVRELNQREAQVDTQIRQLLGEMPGYTAGPEVFTTVARWGAIILAFLVAYVLLKIRRSRLGEPAPVIPPASSESSAGSSPRSSRSDSSNKKSARKNTSENEHDDD